MNKVSGIQSDFALLREEGSRVVIGYGLTKKDETMYEWYEVYLPKTKFSQLTLADIRKAIVADIDSQTDEKILSGYEWTVLHGEDAGKTVNVWLSAENQNNYKAKHDVAKEYPDLVTWPMKYKIGEDEDRNPAYEYFENIGELAQFFIGGISHIEQTVNAGWQKKDAIDWAPYAALFPAASEASAAAE